MYRKTIKFKDYFGTDREDVFDFNLSDSEIIELEKEYDGSITQMLETLSDKAKQNEIVNVMKRIILQSYGKISEDGIRFEKSDAIRDSFYQTEAYSNLFMELTHNDNAAAKFFEFIISNDIHRDGET